MRIFNVFGDTLGGGRHPQHGSAGPETAKSRTMRLLFIGFLFSLPMLGQQQVMEDFACATASAVASAPGGPTTLSCLDASGNPQAHGFKSGMSIEIWGANGNWKPLNTQTFQVLKMVVTASGTRMYLNDTGMMENTPGSKWQLYPETQSSVCNNGAASQEQVTLNSIVDSRTITVARGGSPTAHCNEDYFWGPLERGVKWTVTVTDATHFTVPLDSSAFGSFGGQAIHVNRASAYASTPVPILSTSTADG